MNLTCYIIDDEAHAIEALTRHIQAYPGLELLGSTVSELEAIENIRKLKPDITFMDIDLPQFSGLDLFDLVQHETLVIFTTAYPAYAVASYDKDVVDYLLKPVSFSRFVQSIDKAVSCLDKRVKTSTAELEYIFINTGTKNTFIKVYLKDIYYVKGLKNYVQIYLNNTRHITYLTLSELEEKLGTEKFVRTHKSYLVNLSNVTEFNGRTLLFSNDHTVPLGKTYIVGFNLFLNKYLLHSKRKPIHLKIS